MQNFKTILTGFMTTTLRMVGRRQNYYFAWHLGRLGQPTASLQTDWQWGAETPLTAAVTVSQNITKHP